MSLCVFRAIRRRVGGALVYDENGKRVWACFERRNGLSAGRFCMEILGLSAFPGCAWPLCLSSFVVALGTVSGHLLALSLFHDKALCLALSAT